jgi:polyphosphate kinase 2 (PPK2 family)
VKDITSSFWESRFEQINAFEKMLAKSGTRVLKFFLHVSKHEQKNRFLKRIEVPEKNWKISMTDAEERAYWKYYQRAYEETLSKTSTHHAPWYVIPADNIWFMRTLVSDIIVRTLQELKPEYPTMTPKRERELVKIKRKLMKEP